MAQNFIGSVNSVGHEAQYQGQNAGERRAEIPAGVDRIANDVEQLASVVDSLLERLEPVLQREGDEPKTGSGLQTAESLPITPMGDRLRALSYRLSNLKQRVSEASYRLEL